MQQKFYSSLSVFFTGRKKKKIVFNFGLMVWSLLKGLTFPGGLVGLLAIHKRSRRRRRDVM
jgi:hypothetical protein